MLRMENAQVPSAEASILKKVLHTAMIFVINNYIFLNIKNHIMNFPTPNI